MAKKAAPSNKADGRPGKAEAKRVVAPPPADAAVLQRRIGRLEAKLKAAQAQIAALGARADTDFLLDILNRRGFERAIIRAIAYLRRYPASAAIVYLDVDGLKPVNDRFGHAAGDALLKAIVQLLTEQVRLSDVVARLGGDEFGLLLWNLSERDAAAKARALEKAVAALTVAHRGHVISAGISAGVTMLNEADVPDAAIGRADAAMYLQKRSRKSRKRVRPIRR